jgi:hypothetical protein
MIVAMSGTAASQLALSLNTEMSGASREMDDALFSSGKANAAKPKVSVRKDIFLGSNSKRRIMGLADSGELERARLVV